MAASDLFDAFACACLKESLIVGSTFTCSEAVHIRSSEAGRSENRERLRANLRVNLFQLHAVLPARPDNHASLAPQIRASESGFELSHG